MNDPVTYREVANDRWFRSLPRQLRMLAEERRNPKTIQMTAEPDPGALDGLLESPSPIRSLWKQVGDLYEEFRNPVDRAEVSAEPDPSALDDLIEHRSPLASVALQLRAIFEDWRNPAEVRTTAAPVPVPSLWSKRRVEAPLSASVAGHVFVVLIIFSGVLGAGNAPVAQVEETWVPLYLPVDLMMLPQEEDTSGGGGGGGKETLTAPSLGEPPRAAEKQLVPPAAEPPVNRDPILVAEPTIVAPQLASLNTINLPNLGDPLEGIPAPPSSGPGVGGGIGTGQGRGVGSGDGPGLGPGEGGGVGGGVFRVGGGITPPTILSRTDPVYSEAARKAQYQGTVVLEAIVRKDGSVEILRVVRSLGLGLDENAMAALREWKFRPAMRNGLPVDVALNIEVNFNLR